MDSCATISTASPDKRVKRRRRSPSLVTLNNEHLPLAFQLDQTPITAAATTTITKRSSRFRGVSRHRWTGRFEAHLWDKESWNETQKKKGKQVYLGAYDEEEAAARSYDLAAIKYWGASTYTNFPISDYESEVEIMQNMTREEYLASLRRRSSGFARGVSKYRGVARPRVVEHILWSVNGHPLYLLPILNLWYSNSRHHHNGRWEARIGRIFGNKYLYLGTYGTQEEAAHAYDIAAIEYRGINAVTNFDLSTYIRWLRPTNNSSGFQGLTSGKADSISCKNLNKEPDFSNATSFGLKTHEIIERKMPLSPLNKATSPSALGILLRSSLFKELVEKTNGNGDDGVISM